jgi:hypothetical protein
MYAPAVSEIVCAARYIAPTVDPKESARFSDRQQIFSDGQQIFSDRQQIFSDRQQFLSDRQQFLFARQNRYHSAVRKNC